MFPPVISMSISLLLSYSYKNYQYLIPFTVFFVLFLTYNFFSIDNINRFFSTSIYYNPAEPLISDPLNKVLYFCRKTLGWQSSHFFYLLILAIFIFYLKTISKFLNNKWSIAAVIIFLIGINYRYAIDLLYYTLALMLSLFYMTYKTELKLYDYVVLIFAVYIIHPGILLLLLPSFFLNYMMHKSMHKSSKRLYYISLLVLYAFFFILSRNTATFTVGIPAIDNIISTFNSYMGDQTWGRREGTTSIYGITYTILYYIIPFIYLIVFFTTLFLWEKIRYKKILALFQTSVLFYPNFIDYVTLTERVLVVMSVTFIFVFMAISQIHNTKIFNTAFLSLICSIIFLFNITKTCGAIMLSNVFRSRTYTEIQLNSLYMPSILLFDYKNNGFSDEYIIKNADIKF